MEITKTFEAGVAELVVVGRLDAYWADHLTSAIEDILHAGTHHLRVDMSSVPYMSSAGVRLLLRFRKQAQQLSGSFIVIEPSVAVRTVLEMAGLVVLFGDEVTRAPAPVEGQRFEIDGAAFERFVLDANAALRCRVLGDSLKLQREGYADADCRPLDAGVSTIALGLGVLGGDYEGCRGRFGEFLAAGGAAACQPADGTNRSDYLVSAGALVPTLQVLYGVACEGTFQKLVRFDCDVAKGPVTLSRIVRGCLDGDDAAAVGIVIIAESAGLMGATLRRSPDTGDRLHCDMPAVREWLSFTPERVHNMGVALAVGVVARAPSRLDPFLRPLEVRSSLTAHFHAATFPYRPLRKGRIDLRESVQGLFESETVQSVLHLLNDDREIVGGGESAFVRGACWVSPLSEISG
ncbi:MAG: STAS domain-containing protein [Deltaproteobacteria bacterium]|nr:STAS domain-containing protein [Deltaproteobacteria bacterium]MBI3390682.1 STAS domain-containing protein [Deltaproteobacteria bacterium]